MFYLAQASISNAIGSNIPAANEATAKAVAASWDKNWTTFFDKGLYQAINTSMLGFALLFFTISAVLVGIQWMNSHNDELAIKLISPFLILMLLVNGGALTRQMIYTVRNVSNNLDTAVFKQLELSQTLNNRFDALKGEQDSLLEIQRRADSCRISTPVDAQACMDGFNELVKTKMASGKIKNRDILDKMSKFRADYLQTIADRTATGANIGGNAGGGGIGPAQAVGATIGMTVGAVTAIVSPITDAVAQVALTPFMAAMFFIMMAITSAVQNLAEASMLLTSLIAPIYITTALLPNGSKSLITLCTSYWGIISFKLCYIIIVGLCSQMMVDNGSSDTVVLSLITGLGAPILAGILAKGAGMGFFNAAEGAVAKSIGFAADVGMGFATGGTSSVGAMIGSKIASKTK
jgi:hypothetical protein